MTTTPPKTTANDVLLYIPNLIGYARVILTLGSLILMMMPAPVNWSLAIVMYISSFVGDLFDGMAARKFNQCSTYGGLLDMVTDRCSTLGLLYILGGDYNSKYDDTSSFPWWKCLFLCLILLDISSHWCQMFSTCSLQQHHKSKDGNANRNIIVRLYYEVYLFFGYCCVGAEFTYICLYITQFLQDSQEWYATAIQYALYACIPGCVIKQIVNVYQLCSACYAVADHDAKLKNK
mmetsp:Transcript_10307/g.14562  ORF Transcript_10307/g.14562 Transcript_10307/m.14562 type:complete len:234 (+) Transcript_10307:146-847(+)